jgi:hypothetical protein
VSVGLIATVTAPPTAAETAATVSAPAVKASGRKRRDEYPFGSALRIPRCACDR